MREERRQSPRYEFQTRVSFSAERVRGEGKVHNLSAEGCLIESDTKVSEGAYLALSLILTEGQPPLDIELAAVRWVKGRAFGVQFMFMSPEADQRLATHIKLLISSC